MGGSGGIVYGDVSRRLETLYLLSLAHGVVSELRYEESARRRSLLRACCCESPPVYTLAHAACAGVRYSDG